MPPKKDKDKKKKKKKEPKTVPGTTETADVIMKRLLRCYEKTCAATDSQMCPGIRSLMKECIENSNIMVKFILESIPLENEDDMPVLIEPLLATIRNERYVHVKDIYIWDYPISYENMATLSLVMEKRFYPIRTLELMDCLIPAPTLQRFTRILPLCSGLTTLSLDFNEFGDQGCRYLCAGLDGNHTMLSLSLRYCCLTVDSGSPLGRILATTTIKDIYLDGNDLECEGIMNLIGLCLDQARVEANGREEIKRLKEAEEADRLEREKGSRSYRSTTSGNASDKDLEALVSSTDKKKKKVKKKKKKKDPPPPPKPGPWVHKLHLADNGIDTFSIKESFSIIPCMQMIKRLIMYSTCLEEIDLEDNLIGDIGGKEIVEGLEFRKEEKFSGVKIRTSHRMSSDTFNTIVKLGAGGLKKKKKKKEKKKKK